MFDSILNYLVSGMLTLPWWGYIAVVLVNTQITIFAVTIYLHRCQSHRALTLHPIVSHFFRFWLWMTTGMETKQFVAIHRKHHAKVETDEDPHSPIVKGLKKVLFEGNEIYSHAKMRQETMDRYGDGTPNDWIERNIYTRHSGLGLKAILFIYSALFGLTGVIIWAVQMAWIPFFAAGVINGVGHFWGYRNFEVKDASRNIFPIGFFIGGEELHNNHHAFGASAKFSSKWWEFDIGWLVIRTLQLFGLAKPKRVQPKPKRFLSKNNIDTDTIAALITYRFHVMAHYAREVMLPMFCEERKYANTAGRTMLCQARTALVRHPSLLEPSHKMQLANVLETFQSLRVTYQLRIKLQDIWSRTTATKKELLEALNEWCQQAEATNIDALRKFVRHLKTYVPSGNTGSTLQFIKN